MKSPKIRFKEFQNDWNSRILGDIAKRIVRKNSKNETNLPLTISSQFGLIDQKKFFNHQVASKDLSNYYLLYKNEFAYNKSYSNGYDFGSIKRLKFYDKGALSTLYICFSFNDKYNTQFFEYYFDTLKWYKDIENICAEGARNHGLLNVLSSDFFTIKTRIPSDIKEQEKIGEIFRKIDGILDLENSRFKKLENFKKTMLDKLFVKDGADEPQIRLGSFKGEWNSRILGDIFKERTERSAVGELLSVSILKGVTKFNELNRWDKSSQDKSNYKVVKKGDIAYNSMRMWQGASGLSKYDGIVSPAYTILEPCENTNSLFFSYMFKKDEMLYKFRIKSQGLTSDTWNLKYTNLKSIEVRIPNDIKEQEKIGEFFRKIDGILEFSQKKITKLENIKKYLLNKMFV